MIHIQKNPKDLPDSTAQQDPAAKQKPNKQVTVLRPLKPLPKDIDELVRSWGEMIHDQRVEQLDRHAKEDKAAVVKCLLLAVNQKGSWYKTDALSLLERYADKETLKAAALKVALEGGERGPAAAGVRMMYKLGAQEELTSKIQSLIQGRSSDRYGLWRFVPGFVRYKNQMLSKEENKMDNGEYGIRARAASTAAMLKPKELLSIKDDLVAAYYDLANADTLRRKVISALYRCIEDPEVAKLYRAALQDRSPIVKATAGFETHYIKKLNNGSSGKVIFKGVSDEDLAKICRKNSSTTAIYVEAAAALVWRDSDLAKSTVRRAIESKDIHTSKSIADEILLREKQEKQHGKTS